jgi:hypothetical protein
MRIAHVTASMGGGGHLTRGCAIGRALERVGSRDDYRMFGPAIPYSGVTVANYAAASISNTEMFDAAQAAQSQLGQLLLAFDPDLLLIDQFWLPLQHLLGHLPRTEVWLMAHLAPSTWFIGPRQLRFDRSRYHRLIAVEPPNLHRLPEQIDPVVVTNPDECLPRSALREFLDVPDDVHLTLVAQTGMLGEAEALVQRLGHTTGIVRVLSLHQPPSLFPLAPYLAGADLIVGGAGYNLFWEIQWLGLSARTRFIPQYRDIDPQAQRVRFCHYVMRENGADTLARMILGR